MLGVIYGIIWQYLFIKKNVMQAAGVKLFLHLIKILKNQAIFKSNFLLNQMEALARYFLFATVIIE